MDELLSGLTGSLSDVIELFMPGFVFMCIFCWIRNMRVSKSLFGFWCLFVSVLVKNACLIAFRRFDWSLEDEGKVVLFFIVAIISAAILGKLSTQMWFKELLVFLFHQTDHNDLLDEVLRDDKPLSLVVYTHDGCCHVGQFSAMDDKGDDSVLSLIEYLFTNVDTTVNREDQRALLLIPKREIAKMEVVYEEGSRVWEHYRLRGVRKPS